MERLIERLTDDLGHLICRCEDCGETEELCPACYDPCMAVEKALIKLRNYEDLEEQGLLLKLPVAEGSTIYTLGYIYECKHDYDCVLKASEHKYKCEEDISCEHEIKVWRVRESIFNYKMLKALGKTVFLTKSEAEKALAEMEK